jgi:MFS family permease
MQLYAVLGNPVTDPTAQLIIAGGAAIANIVVGLLAVLLYTAFKRAYYARLFAMFLAAYMLMAGFGYLFIDSLFYNPTASFFTDWQYVIHALGGEWGVRIPVLIVGVVGLLAVFFWLPNAALRFVSDPTDKSTRQREMLRLTLIPYIVVNLTFTLLGVTHPLGAQAVGLVIFPYWFGYIALFWAYFIGGLWTDVKTPFADAPRLAARTLPAWMIGTAATAGAICVILVIGLDF